MGRVRSTHGEDEKLLSSENPKERNHLGDLFAYGAYGNIKQHFTEGHVCVCGMDSNDSGFEPVAGCGTHGKGTLVP
jgi:hypothetical protein